MPTIVGKPLTVGFPGSTRSCHDANYGTRAGDALPVGTVRRDPRIQPVIGRGERSACGLQLRGMGAGQPIGFRVVRTR